MHNIVLRYTKNLYLCNIATQDKKQNKIHNMKKIIILSLVILLSGSMGFAQKAKTVAAKDVPERYTRDFVSKSKGAKDPVWTLVDSSVYDATYVNEQGNKMAIRFSPKGTETRWFIEPKWYPHAITDTIAHNYPKYKITELYALMIKNKMTYQTRIARKSGLFSKKEKNAKLINFETDGKLIDVIDLR